MIAYKKFILLNENNNVTFDKDPYQRSHTKSQQRKLLLIIPYRY